MNPRALAVAAIALIVVASTTAFLGGFAGPFVSGPETRTETITRTVTNTLTENMIQRRTDTVTETRLESMVRTETVTRRETITQTFFGTITLTTSTMAAEAGPDPEIWSSVNDFLYQLQDIDLTAVGDTKFDLLIMDYSADGSESGEYRAEQIRELKSSLGGPKLVLAYMSIGEAENYRWYWEDSWDEDYDGIPDPDAPLWLGPSNPDWPDNYKVKYWESGWRAIVYAYLDEVIEAGFDGAYLDIIDAYEFWGPGGESGLDRETAEREMVDFVIALASYARETRGKTNFGIFPQNGEALSSHPDYVLTVSGIGREDVWYDDDTPQPTSDTEEVISYLDIFKRAGKLVLVVDYVTRQSLIDDLYGKAESRGYVPYATVRDLDRLTINQGHKPD